MRLLNLSPTLYGTILVAISAMLYGILGYFGTAILSLHYSVPAMLFWRFLVASLWMMAASLVCKREPTAAKKNGSPSLCNILLLGVAAYCGGSAFYFLSAQYIGTGLAMVIFFSAPVFVALFDWLFNNWQWNRHAILSLTAVIIGLIILKGKGEHALNVIGVFFAVLAGFCYAVYVYRSQYYAKTIDSTLLTLLICLGNTLVFLTVMLSQHQFILPTTLIEWSYITALGIIATAVPIQLMLNGLKYISPLKASILSVLEPVVTVLIGVAVLQENITSVQCLGVMIILSGAIFIQFEKASK